MLTAQQIRDSRNSDFESTFDFKSFDEFVNNYFSDGKRNFLYIGLEYDSSTKYWADKNGRKCKTLAFEKGHKCYIWETNIQIAHSVADFIEKRFKDAGFNTTRKGACGYDHYDVMVVSI